jgi:hypothetical protein
MAGKYHVMTAIDGRWRVVKDGSTKASRTFKTQQEAIRYVVDVGTGEHNEVVVHGQTGRIVRRAKITKGKESAE